MTSLRQVMGPGRLKIYTPLGKSSILSMARCCDLFFLAPHFGARTTNLLNFQLRFYCSSFLNFVMSDTILLQILLQSCYKMPRIYWKVCTLLQNLLQTLYLITRYFVILYRYCIHYRYCTRYKVCTKYKVCNKLI